MVTSKTDEGDDPKPPVDSVRDQLVHRLRASRIREREARTDLAVASAVVEALDKELYLYELEVAELASQLEAARAAKERTT